MAKLLVKNRSPEQGPGHPPHKTTKLCTGGPRTRASALQKHTAAKAAGFKLFWGDDASQQSPDMPDLLLHETAVAWFRRKLSKQRPVCAPWEETVAQWTTRARQVVTLLNDNYRVDRLCQQFPQRLRACKDSEGERLRK